MRPPLLDWYIPQVPGRYPTEKIEALRMCGEFWIDGGNVAERS